MSFTNVPITAGVGTPIAVDAVGGVAYQRMKLVGGAADNVQPIDGDTANGMDVDVTRLPALVASTAVIGHVIVDSVPTTTITGTITANAGSGTLAVSLASVPSHAVTNAGTFAVQESNSAAALASLQAIDDLTLTQGQNTSGQSGVLAMAAVTTSAPTYTTAKTSPLSVDTTGALRVTGASGTTQYAEDLAHTTGDATVFVSAIRRDTTPSSSSGTAGDYSALNVDGNGRLYTQAVIYDAAGTAVTGSSDYTQDGALTVSTTAGPVQVFRATNANPAAVSAADDAVIGLADLSGRQIVIQSAPPEKTWSYASAAAGLVASGTPFTAKAAVASVRNYTTAIQGMNSHQTIGTVIEIRDGAAGTVLWRGWAQFAGGGFAVNFNPPLRGTANTLVEVAEVTTTATAGVVVSLQGFESAL